MGNAEYAANTPWIGEERVKEIKRTVSIEVVLGSYGLLEGMKQKGNRITGKSPFREDNNPSFSCDTSRGLWNDFAGRPVVDGQEVSGDIFGLVMAITNCSFRDAVVTLNERFMSPDTQTDTPEEKQVKKTRNKIKETKEPEVIENVPFGRVLKGRTHIPPLMERGITEDTIKRFGVLYATSGLMKNRICFPIKNREGEVMAYAGRAVKKSDEENGGKYKFPNKFIKMNELFNVDKLCNDAEAKKAVKDWGIILVEGFTDAMVIDQAGFKNVAALMGSTMSDRQKEMLIDPQINPTRRVTLFLDNDEAGQQGKRKIARELISEAFVRYVDWNRATDDEKNEPEHFNHDELKALLGFTQ